MKTEYTSDHYVAALKLIEQLYKDGQIPAYMFRNILNEYADVVDLAKFTVINETAPFIFSPVSVREPEA